MKWVMFEDQSDLCWEPSEHSAKDWLGPCTVRTLKVCKFDYRYSRVRTTPKRISVQRDRNNFLVQEAVALAPEYGLNLIR